MLIEVDDAKTIADLQERFTKCFPYLHIEFYYKTHHWREASMAEDRIDPSKKVGEVRMKHDPGIMQIKSIYQAGKVEKDFKELFGLNAQIYSKHSLPYPENPDDDKLTLREMSSLTR